MPTIVASLLAKRAGLADGRHARRQAERLIAAADGIAVQALFDDASWPADRQLERLAELLDRLGVDLGD